MTERAREEIVRETDVLREAALVSNAVLRRALAIAACEYAQMVADHAQGGVQVLPDAGIGLMVCWVMRASDELEKVKE